MGPIFNGVLPFRPQARFASIDTVSLSAQLMQRIGRLHRAAHLVSCGLDLPEPRALAPWAVPKVVQTDGHNAEGQEPGRCRGQVNVVVPVMGRIGHVLHETTVGRNEA